MARRKKRTHKTKKKDSPLWQWILVGLIAFGLYQGLDYFLASPATQPAPPQSKPASPAQKPKKTPIPIEDTESLKRFLPKNAYPDHYETIPLKEKGNTLIAFIKTIAGKTPGPQGLTNTRPGLSRLHWDGKKYEVQKISFEKLNPALGKTVLKKLEGLPRVSKRPFKEDSVWIYPVRLFLHEDNQEVMAYLEVNNTNTQWAPLHHPSGKKMPAAFLLGTTANTSSKVRRRKHGGRDYLILEHGILEEVSAYVGYRWNIQAYYWNGKAFVYDAQYSQKLQQAKGTEQVEHSR